MKANARNPVSAPMPWLLIGLVTVTTVAALLAPTDGERLAVLAVAEGLVVLYFCVALRRSARPTAAKAAECSTCANTTRGV